MGIRDFAALLRSVDRLLSLEAKHGSAIERVSADLASLRERAIRLENREEVVVEKAKAATGAAASLVAITSSTDLARWIGQLEERTRPTRVEGPAS